MAKSIVAVVLCLIFIGLGIVVYDLFTKGYAHYGDSWQDTPEEALKQETPILDESPGLYTPKLILNTIYFDEIAEMTYISADDTLVSVSFVINEDGQFSVYGTSEETDLDEPVSFLMNGDPKQFDFDSDEYILFPYSSQGKTVYGWCYSGYSFTVNGKVPKKETFEFECQGKMRSIDYWYVEGIPEDATVDIVYID